MTDGMEALKAKMETIVNVFDEFDGNGDKIISIDEMKKIMPAKDKGALASSMEKLCSENNVDASAGLFKRLDLDGDNKLLVKELMFALDETVGLYSIFAEIDADGSGYLEKKELTTLEGRKNFTKKVKVLHPTFDGALADVLDVDGDGLISFAEFSSKLKGFAAAK